MKVKIKEILFVALLFLTLSGCKDDDDNIVEQPKREFALTNFNNSGCKPSAESRSVRVNECLELKGTQNGCLFVKHVNVTYPCAPHNFAAKASIEGKNIIVTEVDIMDVEGAMTTCVCPYDFDYEIGPLEEGETYSMTVVSTCDLGIDDPRLTPDSHEISFSFVYSSTLSKTIPYQKEL